MLSSNPSAAPTRQQQGSHARQPQVPPAIQHQAPLAGVAPPAIQPPAPLAGVVLPVIQPPAPLAGVAPPADAPHPAGVAPRGDYIPWIKEAIQPDPNPYPQWWLQEVTRRVTGTHTHNIKKIGKAFNNTLGFRAKLEVLENVFTLNESISETDKVLIVDYPNLLKVSHAMEIKTSNGIYLYTNFFKHPLVFILNMMIEEQYTKLYIITKGDEIMDSFNHLMNNEIEYDDREKAQSIPNYNNITNIKYNMSTIINTIIEKITNQSITIDIIQTTSEIPRHNSDSPDKILKDLNSYDDCTIMYLAITLALMSTGFKLGFKLISNDLNMIEDFGHERKVLLPYILTKSSLKLELGATNIQFTNTSYLINTIDLFFKSDRKIPSQDIFTNMVCNVPGNDFCKANNLDNKLMTHYYMPNQGKTHILLHAGKPNKVVVNDSRDNVLRETVYLGVHENVGTYLFSDDTELVNRRIPKYFDHYTSQDRSANMSTQLSGLSQGQYDMAMGHTMKNMYKGDLYDYMGNRLQTKYPTRKNYICDGMPYKGRLYNKPYGAPNREQIQQYNPIGTVKNYSDPKFYDARDDGTGTGTHVQYYNRDKVFYYHAGNPRDTLPNYDLSMHHQIWNAQQQSQQQYQERYNRLFQQIHTEQHSLFGLQQTLQGETDTYNAFIQDERARFEQAYIRNFPNVNLIEQQHEQRVMNALNTYNRKVFPIQQSIHDQTIKVHNTQLALQNVLLPELPKKPERPGVIMAQQLPHYQGKYIKYKSKYLELKNKISNVNNNK